MLEVLQAVVSETSTTGTRSVCFMIVILLGRVRDSIRVDRREQQLEPI